MTPHQSVALALRLFAIWLALQTLWALPSFFTARSSQSLTWIAFMLALIGLVSVALWVFPRTIAGKLLPPPDPQPRSSATPAVWLAIGCTLLGLWTLTTAVPRVVYDVSDWMSSEDRSPLWYSILLRDLVALAIAIWLILGAKGVRKILWWAQNVGIRKDL